MGTTQGAEAVSTGWSSALVAPIRVLLARHGSTPLSHEKRFSGSGADPELDDVGRAQVESLGSIVADAGPVDRIITSPLSRTRQTAQILAERFHIEPHVADDLREMDFGTWEGMTFAEVLAHDPEGVARWRESVEVATGGAESMAAVSDRVGRWLRRLLAEEQPGRTLLLVTHVTPIKCLVADALGAPMSALFRMELGPASLSEIAYSATDEGWDASLRSFNQMG